MIVVHEVPPLLERFNPWLVAAIMMHFIRTVTVLHRQARTALSLQHLRLRMINTAMTLTDLLIILQLRETLKVKTAALKWMRPLSAPKKVKSLLQIVAVITVKGSTD